MNDINPTLSTPSPHEIARLGPDALLELEDQLVHNFTPEQLSAYVERLHLLNVSAQTKRAALRTESAELGVERAARKNKVKSNVSRAMDLLKKLQ